MLKIIHRELITSMLGDRAVKVWERRREGAIAAVLTGAAVLGSACGADPDRTKPVQLPAPAATTAAASPTSSTAATAASNEASVREAYEKYWQISIQAFDVPEAKLQSFLADYLADPLLSAELRSRKSFRKYHQALTGNYKPHIVNVKITKGSAGSNDVAEIVDCQDASGVHLIDTKTKKPLPGGQGAKAQGVRMMFALTPDGWLAIKYTKHKAACE